MLMLLWMLTVTVRLELAPTYGSWPTAALHREIYAVLPLWSVQSLNTMARHQGKAVNYLNQS